jgi:RHS repeat-associated protein
MIMPGRNGSQNNGDDYRYGFGGKENDDEVKGQNNHLDFGSRCYDPRVGRFFSRDPLELKFASHTPYNYAINSPLLFIDRMGEDPKVAIIIEKKRYEFDDHYAALKKQGYTVVYAKNGKEALEMMGTYSSPESPIEDLVIISHGSPGGPSNGLGGGIYTDMEFESTLSKDYIQSEVYSRGENRGIVTDLDSPDWDADEYYTLFDEVFADYEDTWADETKKQEAENKFREKTGAVTAQDVADELASDNVSVKDLVIVMGGCNISGYAKLDNQDIFTTELAIKSGYTVYGAQGYTAPVRGTAKRAADLRWIRTDSEGNRTSTGSSVINLGNPENK